MNNEVLKVITENEETFLAYSIVNDLNKMTVLNYIREKTYNSLDKIAKKYDLVLEQTGENIQNIFSYEYGFKFYRNIDWKNISIWFTFAENLADMSYGIYVEKERWLMPNHMEKYYNCKNTEMLAKLCCPDNDVIKEIENKLKELIPEVEEMLNQP